MTPEQQTPASVVERDTLDLYDEKVQEGISWTMRQWGEALGLTTWTQGDGSESVEGDVSAEIHTILVDAGLRDPETNEMAALTQGESRQTGVSDAQINRLSQTLDLSPASVRRSLARLQEKGLVMPLPAAPTPADTKEPT